MGRGLNKVLIIGNLADDPKTQILQSGKTVTNFRVITNESYKDKDGEWVEKAEGHNAVAWGRVGEIVAQYLTKGSQVYLEGKLQHRSYEAKDGTTRYISEIKVTEMLMLGGGGSKDGSSKKAANGKATKRKRKPEPEYEEEESYEVDLDDDLPF